MDSQIKKNIKFFKPVTSQNPEILTLLSDWRVPDGAGVLAAVFAPGRHLDPHHLADRNGRRRVGGGRRRRSRRRAVPRQRARALRQGAGDRLVLHVQPLHAAPRVAVLARAIRHRRRSDVTCKVGAPGQKLSHEKRAPTHAIKTKLVYRAWGPNRY